MIEKAIIKQINNIIHELIKVSLANDYNEVKFDTETNEISWSSLSGIIDLSYVLKNSSYEVIYKESLNKNVYTFMLIDGSLIQIMYKLDRRKKRILSHRLAYLPNPNIDIYSNKENFEEEYYDAKDILTEYSDINSHPVPIRFDFDEDASKYVEKYHSYSHLTLGNYKDCRVPVSTPISPYKFIDFILRNFYYKKYVNFYDKCTIKFTSLLSECESNEIHLSL